MAQSERSVIPYTLDMSVFRPHDRKLARAVFGLPQESRLILFGAQASTSDPRKGYDLLRGALELLSGPLQSGDGVALAVFGASSQAAGRETVAGLPAYFVGRLRDQHSLALLYSAADVLVAPSRQDNLPNTVLEALACGTPCVGFDVGGMGDLIETGRTGLLAPAFDVDSLSRAIEEVLGWDGAAAGARCRAFAEERFDAKLVASRHIELYKRLLARKVGAHRHEVKPRQASEAQR
jgi:glycosyltransferase involved in cell wall biosynthesis